MLRKLRFFSWALLLMTIGSSIAGAATILFSFDIPTALRCAEVLTYVFLLFFFLFLLDPFNTVLRENVDAPMIFVSVFMLAMYIFWHLVQHSPWQLMDWAITGIGAFLILAIWVYLLGPSQP